MTQIHLVISDKLLDNDSNRNRYLRHRSLLMLWLQSYTTIKLQLPSRHCAWLDCNCDVASSESPNAHAQERRSSAQPHSYIECMTGRLSRRDMARFVSDCCGRGILRMRVHYFYYALSHANMLPCSQAFSPAMCSTQSSEGELLQRTSNAMHSQNQRKFMRRLGRMDSRAYTRSCRLDCVQIT